MHTNKSIKGIKRVKTAWHKGLHPLAGLYRYSLVRGRTFAHPVKIDAKKY